MPGTYYAAVEGDPLTSGKGSRVYAKEDVGTIEDESGKPRRMVFIGDRAIVQSVTVPALLATGQA